jgi:hypothetical protein
MKRSARLVLVASLLYGTGAHWAAVQAVAWGGMIAARAPERGMAEAVAETFSGEKPCGVCLIVDRAARPASELSAAMPSAHFIAVMSPALAPAAVAVPVPPDAPAFVPRPAARPQSPPPKPALLA